MYAIIGYIWCQPAGIHAFAILQVLSLWALEDLVSGHGLSCLICAPADTNTGQLVISCISCIHGQRHAAPVLKH
jgi:hypothetical protein